MWVVVGLGNPGADYANTRHNVGFDVLDILAETLNVEFKKEKTFYRAEGLYEGVKLLLIKPRLYMNRSGDALLPVFLKEKNIEGMIVVHDDMDIPQGKLKLKRSGGSGGHKGVQSIIDKLCTIDFYRVKVGIGRPIGKRPEIYVLEKFPRAEKKIMKEAYKQAAQAVLDIVTIGLDKAMNRHHSY